MRKSKKVRKITEKEFAKYPAGHTFLVEVDMPSSKYHRSILRATIPEGIYRQWFLLDAPDLPRRINVHFTKILKTTETVERLTSTPSTKNDIEFVDFSGHKFKNGDVLFGEGKLIKVVDIRSTICVVKVLHPQPTKWRQKEFRYRMSSMRKFLYIEDPTLVLLKT